MFAAVAEGAAGEHFGRVPLSPATVYSAHRAVADREYNDEGLGDGRSDLSLGAVLMQVKALEPVALPVDAKKSEN
jgi:hypothetical protein